MLLPSQVYSRHPCMLTETVGDAEVVQFMYRTA
jgi:hypothetical protein